VRRLSLILALLVLTPAVALVPTTSAASEGEIHGAFVKLRLTRDGNSYQHPGFLMAMDEQGVFVITCDGKDHEITVSFEEVGETRFTLRVEYAIAGRTQWIESVAVEAGEDTEYSHGKSVLTFNVDPQGSEDTERDENDKIDDPDHDEDDPLSGLPLRKK